MTALERLHAAVADLGDDEVAVLAEAAERLRAGRGYYGELRLATERRDFVGDAVEELLDATVYLAADVVRARMRRESTP